MKRKREEISSHQNELKKNIMEENNSERELFVLKEANGRPRI